MQIANVYICGTVVLSLLKNIRNDVSGVLLSVTVGLIPSQFSAVLQTHAVSATGFKVCCLLCEYLVTEMGSAN